MTSNKYSNCKIVWFDTKLKALRDGIITPPIYVRIKPTNRCCHNCFFCVYRSDLSEMHSNVQPNDELSKEKMLEVLDDFKEMGVKAVTYSGGGEPLLHKDIVEVFERTKANGIDLSVITNGQLLSQDRAESLRDAKWVRISMDYYDVESFVESRSSTATSFKTILANVRRFALIRNAGCDLSVNFIIAKHNFEHICDVAGLLKDLGVDNVRFSPVWLDDFLDYHKDIKKVVRQALREAKKRYDCETFRIYHSYNITREQFRRRYRTCYIQQIIPSIGADYNVYNCHNKSYDADAIIGNISNQSFKQMWFSEEAAKHFAQFDPTTSCRCQCANDSKNKFIQNLLDCHGDNYV